MLAIATKKGPSRPFHAFADFDFPCRGAAGVDAVSLLRHKADVPPTFAPSTPPADPPSRAETISYAGGCARTSAEGKGKGTAQATNKVKDVDFTNHTSVATQRAGALPDCELSMADVFHIGQQIQEHL